LKCTVAIMSEAAVRQKLFRPKSKRAQRALRDRAPKVIEDTKKQLLLRGSKTSPIINEALKDLHKLRAPHSLSLHRRNEKRPFESMESVQFLAEKNDCSLFGFGSHSKKRANNLILGRLFDFKLLDMYEFGIDANTFHSMQSFESVRDEQSVDPQSKSFQLGSKPGLLFQGESFQNDQILKDLRVFFVDYFHGVAISKLNMLTFDHVLVFTAINLDEIDVDTQKEYKLSAEGASGGGDDHVIILLRHYKVEYQSSSQGKVPFVHLTEIGPAMDLRLRRHEKGNDELIKESQKTAQKNTTLLNKKPKTKNVFLDELSGRAGKIYIDQSDQNMKKLKTKRMKALRDRVRNVKSDGEGKRKKRKNSNNKKNRIRMNQDV